MTDKKMIVVWDGDQKIVREALPGEIPDESPSIDDYRAAIDGMVEFTARSRQYNSAAHMASYVASTVPAWAEEAKAFVAWRDQVWLAVFDLMKALQEPLPIDTVLEMMPPIKWPE